MKSEVLAEDLEVRGPTVFRAYRGRPDETRSAFRNGWFRTGDQVVREDGRYRIVGRLSVDILKSGGYRLSAIEVEETLRQHPGVADCAVVGIPDVEWGQRVCAAVVPTVASAFQPEELQAWVAERLAPYKVPRRWLALETLPRNAVGKVRKPDVASLF